MTTRDLEQLLEDGALFRLLVDSVRDYAIFAMDLAGRVASWNAGAEHIKGYSADEAVGSLFDMFYTPEDREAGLPQAMLRTAAAEGSVITEGWRVRKDGTRFWGNVLLTSLRNEEGRLVGFAKITRDLTERKQGEEALLRRERLLADAQELTGLGSWEWDVAGDRVTWTDSLYRMYGLEPDQFEATFDAYLERVHPDDRERVQATIQQAAAAGAEFDFEERIVRPDGSERILHSRGRPVRDVTGRVTQLMGVCLDVTELRRAERRAIRLAREQAAREAAEGAAVRMGILLRASEVLASSLDFASTLDNVVRLAVPELVDWCAIDLLEPDGGLRRVAVEGADGGTPESIGPFFERLAVLRGRDPLAEVVASGEPQLHSEHGWGGPDAAGDAADAAVSGDVQAPAALIVPLSGREGVLGTLTLVQAGSGRSLAQEDAWLARELGRHAALAIENARLHQELEQRQAEAEEASRAKSAFLAATSHELRTPLNAIVGYADLLELEVHGPVNEAQREALHRIKRNQRALLALINDVLNFAQVESGRLEMSMEEIPVDELVADMRTMVAPQVEAKGLRYTSRTSGPDVRLIGDRERTEQILLNLLTNAIKFTPTGGSVELSADVKSDAVVLKVQDTGVGIPAKHLEAVFDPFVQVRRGPEGTAERGVGLGLAISRDLADAMGGTLFVQSVEGAGATFTLTLRRAPEREPSIA